MSAPDAMFRPLDAAEAAPAAAAAAADDWRAIFPAPLPRPEAPRHKRHGAPSRVWRYLDAVARLLHAVLRFDTASGKEILPYCCGADGWRF
ncbi:MAG: hypothetical protein ACK52I_17965 [Pseudomonadota bacterium]